MKLELFFDNLSDEDISQDLESLVQEQVNAGVPVERHFAKDKQGEKTIFDIESLTLIVTSISTVISVFALWLQTRPKFTIETEIDGNKIMMQNPSEEDLNAILTNNQELTNSSKVKFIVNKKTESDKTI